MKSERGVVGQLFGLTILVIAVPATLLALLHVSAWIVVSLSFAWWLAGAAWIVWDDLRRSD